MPIEPIAMPVFLIPIPDSADSRFPFRMPLPIPLIGPIG
jgi:hypothetical protein